MRIALISDVHGNLVALEAVLERVRAAAADLVICLGDVALAGPRPRAVIPLLAEAADLFILGNTDAWALDPQPFPSRNEDTQRFYEIELWGAGQLGAAERRFLRSFRPTARVALEGAGELLAYHGSPRSFDDGIVPTTPEAELDTYFAAPLAAVLAGGHAHEPFVRRFRQSQLLNPGSVGLAYVREPAGATFNLPWAEYAILDVVAGVPQIQLCRVTYDLDRYVDEVQRSGMPHAQWWLDKWRAAPT